MRTVTDRPNIILVNCDDLGYGDLSCYGSEVNRTPALDGLASDGVRLTEFYMASSVCSPSRGAMLTGCYPRRIGFDSFDGRGVLFPGQACGLSEGEITIADLLKQQGYATCCVGKWHCGDQPEFLPIRHGFDHYYGLPYSNDMGRQKADDIYPPLPLVHDEEVIQQQPDQANLIERYTDESIRFMRQHRDEPFFLYLAHMQVHLPLYAPSRFIEGSQNGRYGGCVEAVDWNMAVLRHELRRLGIEENTLIIFTSDNGSRGDNGGSNAPLAGQKASTWEGGFRVPCIVCWPGTIPAGRTCEDIVSSIDFLPTLVGLAGGQTPDDRIIDGLDMAPLWRGEQPGPRETFVYYHRSSLEAVRRGKYKLWVRRGEEDIRELYDLKADIGETTNLAEQQPDVVRELEALADEVREDMGDEATGQEGANRRPLGRVENPDTLTHYDPTHPYIIAEYDLPDRG